MFPFILQLLTPIPSLFCSWLDRIWTINSPGNNCDLLYKNALVVHGTGSYIGCELEFEYI